MTHIDYAKLESLAPVAAQSFAAAKPYPHLVIDGFLCPASYRAVLAAVPAPSHGQKSSDYIFARNKFENPRFDEAAAVLAELKQELLAPAFAAFLAKVYGTAVFVDEQFVGGGLHQGGEGSFLDMHADFSRHPVHKDWVREMNLLLYLNDGYEETWGGHLEMRNADNDEAGRVAPVGNRMVIMLTKGNTLHGYKPIAFPASRLRTSIAAYAYSIGADFEAVPDRSTLWRPQDAGPLKAFASKLAPTLIQLKRKAFGSSTAKRAQRKPR